MAVLTEDELINALEKALPEIAEEHREGAVAWEPHDFVPWSKGRNFAFLGGEDWDPSEESLNETARAALLALLLTKDNLPSFHRVLSYHFPPFSEWRELIGVWTAEDNRHAIALRDYLVVTRVMDPVDAENRRRIHVVAGWRQTPESVEGIGPMDVLALLAVHENQCVQFIAKLKQYTEGDEALDAILDRVSTDDAVQAATFQAFLMAGMVADQEATIIAVDKALAGIEHIGADVADFDAQREFFSDFEDVSTDAAIAAKIAGELKLDSAQELSDEAEAARQRILALARGQV